MNIKRKIRIIDIIFLVYVISVFIFSTDVTLYYLSNYAFVFFAVSTLFWVIVNKKGLWSLAGLRYYMPFLLVTLITIPFALNSSLAFEIFKTEVMLVVMVIFIYNCYIDEGNVDWILITFIIAGSIVSLQIISKYGISGVFSGMLTGSRVGDDLFQLSYLGRFSYWAALLALYYSFVKKHPLCYVLVLLNTFVCIGSGSRQSWIALIICCFLVITTMKNENKKVRNVIAAILFLGAIYVVITNPAFSAVLQRLSSGLAALFSSAAGSHSDQIRVAMLRIGLQTFEKNPIIGIGYGNISEIASGIIQNYSYLHNNYVELLACGGIVGFGLYYSIYIILLRRLIKLIRSETIYLNEAKLAVILLVGQLLLDMFAVNYYSKQQFIIFAYCFLVVFRGNLKNEKEREDEN